MKRILSIFRSKYCWFVFVISIISIYFLVPKNALYGYHKLISYPFIISSALVVTCIVRNVKERIVIAKTYKSSIVGILATGIGFLALQVCGIGLPVCGATIGVGILSLIPTALMSKLSRYAVVIISISILLQLLALYFMNCFYDENENNKGNKRNKK